MPWQRSIAVCRLSKFAAFVDTGSGQTFLPAEARGGGVSRALGCRAELRAAIKHITCKVNSTGSAGHTGARAGLSICYQMHALCCGSSQSKVFASDLEEIHKAALLTAEALLAKNGNTPVTDVYTISVPVGHGAFAKVVECIHKVWGAV